MRYLWVEDFDNDSENKCTIKEGWEQYFELEGKTRVFQTLEGVLNFLDTPSNWKLFDAVLIDIRFCICEKLEEDDIYIKYFSEFLKKEKFVQYARKINGDPSSASAGILLFLALVHRYNYNQNRIAFISANVDGTGNKLACLKSIKEFLYKAQYEKLTDEDIAKFSDLNEILYDRYCEARSIAEKENYESIPEKMDFPCTDEIDWKKNVNGLFEKIDRIEKLIVLPLSAGNEDKLKYNSVKAEFDGVGLLVPVAFEKPSVVPIAFEESSESKPKSWSFKFWSENKLETEYYQLRTLILPICLNLQMAITEKDEEIIKPYKNIDASDNAKNELLNMLANIAELFPPNIWTENNDFLYTRIVKECVNLCEKMEKSKVADKCKGILKLTRNWLSHQGIENIASFDVAFVFHVMINTFFSLSFDEKCKELDQIMISNICTCDENIANYEEVVKKCGERAKKCHYNAFNDFLEELKRSRNEEEIRIIREKGYKEQGNCYMYKEDALLYDTISGIGNTRSPIKKSISMKDLYLLFLDNTKGDEYKWEKKLIAELINKLDRYRA